MSFRTAGKSEKDVASTACGRLLTSRPLPVNTAHVTTCTDVVCHAISDSSGWRPKVTATYQSRCPSGRDASTGAHRPRLVTGTGTLLGAEGGGDTSALPSSLGNGIHQGLSPVHRQAAALSGHGSILCVT